MTMHISNLKFILLLGLISKCFSRTELDLSKFLQQQVGAITTSILGFPQHTSAIKEGIRNLELEVQHHSQRHQDIYNVAKSLTTSLANHMDLPRELVRYMMELEMLIAQHWARDKSKQFVELKHQLGMLLRRLRNIDVPPELQEIFDRNPDSITPFVSQALLKLRLAIAKASGHRLRLINAVSSLLQKAERYFND